MYCQGGENTFMPDTDDPQMPGKVGLQAIGGIVTHLGGADRDRLLDRQLLPAAVGHRLLGAGVRRLGLPEPHHGSAHLGPGPLRVPPVDSMVNPYLMAGATLKAADDGIDNDLDPGEPEDRNIYQAMEAGKQVKKLPMTLGEALDALKATTSSSARLPGEMYRLYDEYKRDEWERFMSHRHRVGQRHLYGLPALSRGREAGPRRTAREGSTRRAEGVGETTTETTTCVELRD